MTKLILAALIVTSTLLATSKQQERCYKIVYDESRKHKINGYRYPTTFVAMARTESNCVQTAWGDLNQKTNSIGTFQAQIPTIRWLATKYKWLHNMVNNLTDFQIATRLIKDIRFSTKFAVYYIKYYMEHGYSYKNALIMYNGWWTVRNGKRVKNNAYYRRVMNNKDIR